ncbi:hypothetical protein BDP27DRAFT_1372784 [Rhodocollybia butyracea]|uniref:Uncharacterized protein n=1 Tax=Rhodocollybia butyracea TaxID=206335 RepID=A0A9P5PA01_9AGAR|nr:hypothetical protein BDP27DRAFT_1372784 [Rhodocollybia butyracea]
MFNKPSSLMPPQILLFLPGLSPGLSFLPHPNHLSPIHAPIHASHNQAYIHSKTPPTAASKSAATTLAQYMFVEQDLAVGFEDVSYKGCQNAIGGGDGAEAYAIEAGEGGWIRGSLSESLLRQLPVTSSNSNCYNYNPEAQSFVKM